MARLALASAVTFAACGGHWTEESSVETVRFELGSAEPQFEARIDSGSIEVTGSESNVVEITVRKSVRAFDSETARNFLERIEVEATQDENRIRLRAFDRGFRHVRGADLRTDVTVRLPSRADLDLRTGDGRIVIESVRGELLAETEDGRISIADLAGNLRLRTEDGSIVGRGIEGGVDAITGDGRIELEGRFKTVRAVTSDGSVRIACVEGTAPEGHWTLRTGDGSVRLSLPKSVSVDIEASTNDGVIDNRLSRFEGDQRDGRLRGRVGNGGPLLFLSTDDGRIELTES